MGSRCAVKWAVKQIKCGWCGEVAVHVYPAHLRRIQCKCGGWVSTRKAPAKLTKRDKEVENGRQE